MKTLRIRLRVLRAKTFIWLLSKHDWLFWHCRPLWTRRVNLFLLRNIR